MLGRKKGVMLLIWNLVVTHQEKEVLGLANGAYLVPSSFLSLQTQH